MLRKEDIRKIKQGLAEVGSKDQSLKKKREDMDTFAQARMFGYSNKNKFVDTNFND